MLNVFVPAVAPTLPAAVRGLRLERKGEVQTDFAARRRPDDGLILSGGSSHGCLCDLDDWPALHELLEALLDGNRVSYVEALLFWSRDRYELRVREIDPEEPDARVPLVQGEIVVLRRQPRARRLHRQVVRALASAVGRAVTVRWKMGRASSGVLVSFDPESELGQLDTRAFVAAEVLAVEVR